MTREEWGALPPRGTSTDFEPQGVTFHYEGVPASAGVPDHSTCASTVRNIQRMHLDHPTEDYDDIAYSFLVCVHGSVFEGRGLHIRSGANGTASANRSYYSVCLLIGTNTLFRPALARGGVDAIDYLRQNGAGGALNGHRDHIATACPGTAAYSWVEAGCPLYAEDLGEGVPSGYRNHWPYGWLHGGLGLPAGEGGLSPQGGSDGIADVFPGSGFFGSGANNDHVTQLGRALVARGGARFYEVGPGPVWSDADLRATKAFQEAQGWSGSDADGLPGSGTWRLLVAGTGNDIQPASGNAYPGAEYFLPGSHNDYVTLLGRQLVAEGYGGHYTSGPGPRWSEADRLNVRDFQLAQGWTGNDANGYPGPYTWARLFGQPTGSSSQHFPGAGSFGPGAANDYVTELGR
ncbi:peptidoglycan-binding protein, partial [Streptomyces pratensis]|uniref:peptidoglycan-binding protein n=1 Tax=Streptomyces pratensis TaxID=1169025 RepID=UPI003017CDD0